LSWESGEAKAEVDFENASTELTKKLYAVLGYLADHEISYEISYDN
jgi:hypothetical protein